MAQPVITAAIAFTTGPSDVPSWTDVTAYLQGFSWSSGRQTERDRFETGSGTLVLDNPDRRFEPGYASGAYYPNVIPMKRVRVRATWNAVTYDLFHGYVENWGLDYPDLDANAVLRIVDGQGLLMDAGVTGSPIESDGATRISTILDAAGWPSADRTLGVSQNTVPASTLEAESAMQHLLKVDEAENGVIFIAKDGKLTFQNRHARLLPTLSSIISLGPGGSAHYQQVRIDYDNVRLFTAVAYTREAQNDDDEPVTQALENATGVATYLRRTLSKSGLLNDVDAETYMAASHDLERQLAPGMRVVGLDLDAEDGPSGPATLWPQLLGRELGDRITVIKTPPGGGAAITQVSNIERRSMEWTANGGVWAISWSLSPADTTAYWMLGNATYSVLGSTTKLGY